jgi:hypothetical protein
MALPVILIDSATGSDTNTSGAGPGTAVTGTNASTNGGGTVVTVDAGTDISGIATDGSAAIYLNDTTAGHRRWSKITATAGSGGATPTITVNEAFTGSLSGKSWAVGGKRASILGAASVLLLENNSSAGDAMPGWIMQMASGHAESATAGWTWRRSGDTTNGPISLVAVTGYVTRPALTITGTGTCVSSSTAFAVTGIIMRGITFIQSNGSPGATMSFDSLKNSRIEEIEVDQQAANIILTLTGGSGNGGPQQFTVRDCYFDCSHASADAVNINGGRTVKIINTYVRSRNGNGIHADNMEFELINCVADRCGAAGVRLTDSAGQCIASFLGLLCVGNTGDGFISFQSSYGALRFTNCGFSGNGGYGTKWLGSDAIWASVGSLMLNCGFYNNTSGDIDLGSPSFAYNTVTGSDPLFTAASSLNWMLGSASPWKATGYPKGGTKPIGLKTPTYSYVDIGVAQRICAAILGYLLVKN